MAKQYCTQRLDSWLKLVHHSKSSILAFCVSHFTFSLVATLGNLLVIRALIKPSTIPANVKKLFLSLAFSDLAVLGLLLQLMKAIIYAVVWKMASRGDNLASLCPTVLSVYSYFVIFWSLHLSWMLLSLQATGFLLFRSICDIMSLSHPNVLQQWCLYG